MDLGSEARAFAANQETARQRAAQRVALLCNGGIDVDRLELGDAVGRAALVQRLRRLIERERIRGSNRHWSYDLNRHIALKQALDEIEGARNLSKRPAPRRRRRLIIECR